MAHPQRSSIGGKTNLTNHPDEDNEYDIPPDVNYDDDDDDNAPAASSSSSSSSLFFNQIAAASNAACAAGTQPPPSSSSGASSGIPADLVCWQSECSGEEDDIDSDSSSDLRRRANKKGGSNQAPPKSRAAMPANASSSSNSFVYNSPARSQSPTPTKSTRRSRALHEVYSNPLPKSQTIHPDFILNAHTLNDLIAYNLARFREDKSVPDSLSRLTERRGYVINGELFIDLKRGRCHSVRTGTLESPTEYEVENNKIKDWRIPKIGQTFTTECIAMTSRSGVKEFTDRPHFLGEETRQTWILGSDNRVYPITADNAFAMYDNANRATITKKRNTAKAQKNNADMTRICVDVPNSPNWTAKAGGVMSFLIPYALYFRYALADIENEIARVAAIKAGEEKAKANAANPPVPRKRATSGAARVVTAAASPIPAAMATTQTVLGAASWLSPTSYQAEMEIMELTTCSLIKRHEPKIRAEALEDNISLAQAFRNWTSRTSSWCDDARSTTNPLNTIRDLQAQFHSASTTGPNAISSGTHVLYQQARIWSTTTLQGRILLQKKMESYEYQDKGIGQKRGRKPFDD